MAVSRKNVLFLFDVDGTLTPSRLQAPEWLRPWLAKLREEVTIGFVGGSDLPKQKEQIGEDIMDIFDFCFAENGLVAYEGKNFFFIHQGFFFMHAFLRTHTIKRTLDKKRDSRRTNATLH